MTRYCVYYTDAFSFGKDMKKEFSRESEAVKFAVRLKEKGGSGIYIRKKEG